MVEAVTPESELPGNRSAGLVGTCDTHMHFYDGSYPASASATLFPPDASPSAYRDVQQALGLQRVVVVQPTTYGLDNSCQLDAMLKFGHDARGVMVVDAGTTAAELQRLDGRGVVGARFHMLPGGAVPWEDLEAVAATIAELGWHIQLQCNGRELPARRAQLTTLPTALVIDHVGRFMPPVGAADPAFQVLCELMEGGNTWVKLSAPYESSLESITNEPIDDHHADVLLLVDHLVHRYPERLLWATNWPHPGQDPSPTVDSIARQRDRWLPTSALRQQVLVDNPDEVYFG